MIACPNCGSQLDFDCCYINDLDAIKCDRCGRLYSADDISQDELIPDDTPAENIYIWL